MSGAFELPVETKVYLEFYFDSGIADGAIKNVQIEFGNAVTDYEPYTVHTYPLDSTIKLRGIPKLDSSNRLYYDGDTYQSDGTVTRKYGIYTFTGEETWTYYQASGHNTFNVGSRLLTDTKPGGNGIMSDEYVKTSAGGIASQEDKTFQFFNSPKFSIRDDSFTDATAFAAHMAGKTLVYELATPTTETAGPYTNPQIVDPDGTEEYVTTGIVPVGHYTKYPTDIVAKVDGLPSNFSTLIATTEKGMTATKAYAVNNFLIVDNQLYRVTAAIASGATITPGTNVTAVTVADILTQLLNA